MKNIVVVGSLNLDTVIEVPQMPKAGETLAGTGVSQVPGGKGANQAYAIGKLLGNVKMIGAVGNDAPGKILVDNLESVGVDISGISEIKGGTTGQAFITVEDSGENSIIIIAGTNADVTQDLIQNNMDAIQEADIIIMQLEIPLETVEYVKEVAVKYGKMVILDPAPAVAGLPDSFWKGIDYIKPNETELSILVGSPLEDMEEIREGARSMLQKGVKNVLVTLGSEGCLFVTEETEEYYPACKVEAVDTTAAGDSFTAAFALALSRGKSCGEAIQFGQKVSSIAVTRKGAQTSIPSPEEVVG